VNTSKKHEWLSVNRDVHDVGDLTLNDIFEEVRCAVQEQDVTDLAVMLDNGRYAAFGRRIAVLLKIMGGKPANKIAPRMGRKAKGGVP